MKIVKHNTPKDQQNPDGTKLNHQPFVSEPSGVTTGIVKTYKPLTVLTVKNNK